MVELIFYENPFRKTYSMNVWTVAQIFNKYSHVQKIEYKIPNGRGEVYINDVVTSSRLWVTIIDDTPYPLDEFKSLCIELDLSPEKCQSLLHEIDSLNFDQPFCFESKKMNEVIALEVFSKIPEIHTISEIREAGDWGKMYVNDHEMEPFLFLEVSLLANPQSDVPDAFKSLCIELNLSQDQMVHLVNLLAEMNIKEPFVFERKFMLDSLLAKELFKDYHYIQSIEFSPHRGLTLNGNKLPMALWRKEFTSSEKDAELDDEAKAWLVEIGLSEVEADKLIKRILKFGLDCKEQLVPIPEMQITRGQV